MTDDHPTPPRSFEAALAEFEALVEKMERGDLSLEDSVNAYERGVALHRYCERALSTAERKIQILAEGSGEGRSEEEGLQPFEVGAGGTPTADADGSAPASGAAALRRRGTPVPPGDDLPF